MSQATSNQQTAVSLKGRTALVTGSTGGLGHAMAEGLARAGCNIVLHGIAEPQAMRPLQAELERTYGVRAAYMPADLADVGAIAALMAAVAERFGSIDVLVNNAVTRHFAPVEDFPVEQWDQALAVNVSAAFHTIRLALPAMRERGWGRIFNMTSVYGKRATQNRIGYVTTKTALIGMTRAVALETINQGITCNALCPGSVLTPDIDSRIQALMRERDLDAEAATRVFLEGKQPILRFVDAAHVAELVLFLCGPAGRDITGAVLPVEGGWLAS
ncbi:SDR family oxidoreductase [Verticiella sediminum]|uniref:SDR family oxidoreductase n=1 Tax=Verticiella sediminum TaxID=1247510 RepID=UPI0024827E22|nr:SDR family oxidoreductase [Verticiella sediminum]